MQHLMHILTIFIVCCGVRVRAQELLLKVSRQSVYATIGSKFSVNCSCDCQQDLKFTLTNKANSKAPLDLTRYTMTSGRNFATLEVTDVQVSDAGVNIDCQTSETSQNLVPVGLTVYLATVTNGTAQIGETKSVTLYVNVLAMNDAFEQTAIWYRGTYPNGTALVNNTAGYTIVTRTSANSDARFNVNLTFALTISKPDLLQAGPYYLQLISAVYENVYLNTMPVLSVEPLPEGGRSYTAYDGSTFKLSCLAQGYPQPSSISWSIDFVNDQPSVNAATWSRATLGPNRLNQTNGSIQIPDIDYTDRAYFNCMALTAFGNTSVSYLVRVKDPLAALWPGIGIVIEIIVLAAIIIIYEKFKDRFSSESNDDDDDTKNDVGRLETHALAPQSDVELRQRNAHP